MNPETAIIYINDLGDTLVVTTANLNITVAQLFSACVPLDKVVSSRIGTINDLPKDRLFRNAWDDSNPEEFVGINILKAQEITHTMRRLTRENNFKPYDEIISKAIPGSDLAAAESARQELRDSDSLLQISIDNASDEGTLRSIITTENLKDIFE